MTASSLARAKTRRLGRIRRRGMLILAMLSMVLLPASASDREDRSAPTADSRGPERLAREAVGVDAVRSHLSKIMGNPLFDEERVDREMRERYRAMQERIQAQSAARRIARAGAEPSSGVTAGLPDTRKLLVLSANGGDGQLGLFEAETGEFIRTIVPLGSGLAFPSDLAIGADGHIYIANGLSNNVLRYDGQTLGELPGPLGAEGMAEFVPAGSAGLIEPRGVAFGDDGNLYVAVPERDAVYRYAGPSPAGDCAGLTPGAPCQGPSGAADTAEFVPTGSGGLNEPWHLTIGPDGNLYVTDLGGRILRFDGVTGAFVDTFASDCEGPPPSEDFCESASELAHPGGDPASDIIVDYDLRCATGSGVPYEPLFDRDVWYRYQAPCTGTLTADGCEIQGFYDNLLSIYDRGVTGGCPTSTDTRLNYPDGNTGCVAWYGLERHTVEVTEALWYLIRAGSHEHSHGTGSLRISITCSGSAAATSPAKEVFAASAEDDVCDLLLLNDPTDVRFGPDGNLYVCSHWNDRIVRFDGTAGAWIDNVVCPGGGVENLVFGNVNVFTFGPDGRLYTGDGFGIVRRYDLTTGSPPELLIDTNNEPQVPLAYIVWGIMVLPLCGDGVCEFGESYCNCTADCPLPPEFDDCNVNGIPDDCEPDEDCNTNGVRDICDIGAGTSDDCNDNLVPDECEPNEDCNGNGIQDVCDLVGPIGDCNANGIPDDCEADCNANTVPDDCDLAAGTSGDCNGNNTPDECDIDSGTSSDADGGGVPDECESPILYVDSAAPGGNNGTSWLDAYVDLQDALTTADASPHVVSEIRVAQGTYRPDEGTGDRTKSFAMQSGLQIRGGFAGSTGEDPDERGLVRFETVLSGDLANDDVRVEPGTGGGEPDDFCENAGPINTGETTFNSTGATTDGPNPVDCDYGPDTLGSDIWYVYTHSCDTDAVEVSLCGSFFDTFIAVYDGVACPPTPQLACSDDGCGGQGVPSKLVFPATTGQSYLIRVGGWQGDSGNGVIDIRCIESVTPVGGGDPIHVSIAHIEENSHQVVVAENVDATAVLDGFTITAGVANGEGQIFGAGMMIFDAEPTVRNCRFAYNTAPFVGGAVYQNDNFSVEGEGATFEDCSFVANTAWVFSAAATGISERFINCTFAGNETFRGWTVQGGHFTNCVFRENINTRSAGGGCINGPAVIDHCLFDGNVANRGAAAWNPWGDPIEVNDSVFVNNTAYVNGGAIRNDAGHGGTVIRNSLFFNNHADYYGGAIYNLYDGARLTVSDSIFVGNRAGRGGAISQVFSGITTLDHVTITGNSAYRPPYNNGTSGGIHVYGGTVEVSNSILWGNSDPFGTGPSSQIGGLFAEIDVVSSCVQGFDAGIDAAGNIGLNPLLTPDGRLRSGSPCIDAGDPTFVVDPEYPFDVDGDPRVSNGRVDMGADEFGDLDLDGLPDWWELKHFHGPTAGAASEDSDGDGLTNLDEYERYGSNPIAKPYYVSGTAGRDDNDGLASTPEGHGVGPMRSIQAALDVAEDGDSIVVLPQNRAYKGEGNKELDFKHKSTVVRSSDGPQLTAIDLENSGQAIDFTSVMGTFATLEGFTITNGDAFLGGGLRAEHSGLQIRGCVLDANNAVFAGGLLTESAHPTVDGLTLTNNTAYFGDAGLFSNTSVNLEGPLTLGTGTATVFSSWFDGPGYVELGEDTLLHILGEPAAAPTVLRSDLVGSGNVLIDLGQELQVGGGATVDLSGEMGLGSCADPSASDNWGTIWVDGELYVRDATIQNTNVEVSLAEFTGTTDIINNDIALLNASTGFGGQFFVAGTAIIQCNAITSDGDRYLDLDPDPNADPRPTILDNRFDVVVTQGAEGEQGEILELRIRDYDCNPQANPEGCPSGAVELPGSTGYEDTWALESLQLRPDSKVTLTNRQGLVFQDPGTATPETVYVKDLALSPDSVLNVGLQRLYYQSLVDENGVSLLRDPEDPSAPMANGSRIVDVPLLGFSLGIISMNDDTEFAVRVQKRLTDPADFNPDDPMAPLPEGLVTRMDGPLPDYPDDGVLDLQTFNASSVSAKGAFARATEDQVIVSFKYLFRDNPDAELIVYLSDDPEVGDDLLEIARVYPPASGRDGSIDSDEFAFFHGSFPRGDLNFIRGTYVELELRNPGSRVWIDEWDPVVCCNQCGNFSGCGPDAVTEADYLYLLSEYGRRVYGTAKECADSKANGDGYIDISDLLAWELYYTGDGLFNLCGDGSPASVSDAAEGSVTFPPDVLVVAGKQSAGRQDYIYTLDPNGTCTGSRLEPASTPSPNGYRANGRLVRDGSGGLYQLHSLQGLVRLSDAEVVLAPQAVAYEGNTVHVGVTGTVAGKPVGVSLIDAAFDPADDSVIYVVPVLVVPPDGTTCPDGPEIKPYQAAAKLRRAGGPGDYVVEQVYGTAPCPGDGCCNTYPCSSSECNVHRLREIEVDASGNLFVTGAQSSGDNDWMLIYNGGSGEERARLPLDVPAPTAMTIASGGDVLYLASSIDDSDPTSADLYHFIIDRAGGNATGLTLDAVTNIDNMRYITAATEDPADGSLWVMGFTAPTFGDYDTFDDGDAIFTRPTLAVVPPDATAVTAVDVSCHDLALPLSIALNTALCQASYDVEPDSDVDLADFAAFQRCFTGDGLGPVPPACAVFDDDCDSDLDLEDLKAISVRLSGP